eukprot:1234970-Alexandrium_andersonii.AAC.1
MTLRSVPTGRRTYSSQRAVETKLQGTVTRRVPSLPLAGAGAAEEDWTSAEDGMVGKPTLGPVPGRRAAP